LSSPLDFSRTFYVPVEMLPAPTLHTPSGLPHDSFGRRLLSRGGIPAPRSFSINFRSRIEPAAASCFPEKTMGKMDLCVPGHPKMTISEKITTNRTRNNRTLFQLRPKLVLSSSTCASVSFGNDLTGIGGGPLMPTLVIATAMAWHEL